MYYSICKYLDKIYRFIYRKKIKTYTFEANNIFNKKYQKRALLFYKPISFVISKYDQRYFNDTIFERNKIIAKELDKRGFIVDSVLFNRKEFEPKYNYDLIFDIYNLHEKIILKQNKKPYIIVHYTGNYHGFQNSQLLSRLDRIKKKYYISHDLGTKKRLVYPENNCEYANKILQMSNEEQKMHFPDLLHSKITNINNYPSESTKSVKPHKITEYNYRNFLFLASSGTVLKGLDIALEVFSQLPKCNLFVCGPHNNEKEFMDLYSKYFDLPNIKNIGWINFGSKKHRWIVKECTFHFYPSASDGMPGALMNTVTSGLIPIVTAASGISVGDFGYIIDENIDSIVDSIKKINRMQIEELEKMSKNAIAYSQKLKRKFKQKIFTFFDEVEYEMQNL